MQLRIFFFFSLLWIAFSGFSQQSRLSSNAQISVLTCGAGEELYSSFGHTAFRVQDPSQGIDWVYNYGTFNFNTPNFYLKFARGKLLYSLSVSKFTNFLYAYQLENRWVKEQPLELNASQKNRLFSFLENNRKPENRDYKYDFLFDNCATKIPDVLQEVLGDQLVFEQPSLEEEATFRDLIQENLKANSWSSFGIDLALGSVIDRNADFKEYMFLPKYVLRQLNNSSLVSEPLVSRERSILDIEPLSGGYYFTASPLFWLLLLMLFTATITYIDHRNKTRSRWLDFFLFFISGACGLLMFFLWFLTDHSATAGNFNILWAFPANIVICFLMVKNSPLKAWLKKYILGLLVLIGITILLWIIGFQVFSPLLSLTLLTLSIRYFFLYNHLNANEAKN